MLIFGTYGSRGGGNLPLNQITSKSQMTWNVEFSQMTRRMKLKFSESIVLMSTSKPVNMSLWLLRSSEISQTIFLQSWKKSVFETSTPRYAPLTSISGSLVTAFFLGRAADCCSVPVLYFEAKLTDGAPPAQAWMDFRPNRDFTRVIWYDSGAGCPKTPRKWTN